jgi:hypothetical protein
MDAVHVGHKDRDGKHEEKEVTNDKVRTPKGQLNDLDDELAGRLGKSVVAETATIPATGPPRAIGLVVLEFTREEDRDKNLVDRTLDGDHRDESKDGVREVPELEEPLRLIISIK